MVNPQHIQEQLASGEIVLLDVREKSEWDEGHIAGAKHLPLGELSEETTKDLPKDGPLGVYCRSGGRAGVAETLLRNIGFEKVLNIGGITEWQESGGELV